MARRVSTSNRKVQRGTKLLKQVPRMNVDPIRNISNSLKRDVGQLSSSTGADENRGESCATRSRKLLKKLHALEVAVDSCAQAVSTSLIETKNNVYNKTVKLHADLVQEALQDVRSNVYTTVLVAGKSGSGKTHFLNQIINSGLNLSGRFLLTQTEIQKKLFVTVNKSPLQYGQWSPITSSMNAVVCKNASDCNQFCPSIPVTDAVEQIDILPEGDMMCTTKVPIHIFYGSEVKVTFSYTGAEEVSVELKRLLKIIQIISSQVHKFCKELHYFLTCSHRNVSKIQTLKYASLKIKVPIDR